MRRHRACVVDAEAQAHLEHFQSLRSTAPLDVLDVVEEDARNCQRLQLLDRGHCIQLSTAWCLGSLGDKGHKSARLFLQLPHRRQEIDALLQRLVCTRLTCVEEHRRNGAHSQPMRRAMHRNPLGRAATSGAALCLCVVAGDRVHPRVAEARDRLADRVSIQSEGKRWRMPRKSPSNHSISLLFNAPPTPLTRRTPVEPSSMDSRIASNKRCAHPTAG